MELIDDTEIITIQMDVNKRCRNNDRRMELINDAEIMIGWS